jgi:hypothetical protein
MPLLSVSPWQYVIRPPFYYGFFYYAIIAALIVFLLVRNKPRIKWDLIHVLLAVFLLINVLSLMINWIMIDPRSIPWAGGLKSPLIYNLLVTIYLLMNIVTFWIAGKVIVSTKILEKSIEIVVLFSVFASFWGIIMVMGHMTGWLKEEILIVNLFPRLTGTATEPQVFGNFLLLGWPLSLVLLIKRSNWVNLLSVFILSLSLIMTFSMGAWLGALGGLLLIGVLSYKGLSVKLGISLIAILVLIIGCLTIFSLVYPPYLANFDKYTSKLMVWNIKKEATIYKESIKGRNPEEYRGDIVNRFDDKLQRVWMGQAAINMFRAKPLLGVGPGNYGFLYNEYKPSGTPRKPYMEKTHNAYLEILAETGILGLTVFLAIMLILLIKSWPRTLLGAGCYASVVALMIHGLSFGILAHNYTWLAMGLLWAQRDINV